MPRRTLNRKELRADYDAAERQKPDDDESDETEDEVEDESDEDEEEEAEAEKAPETDEEAGEEDEEEADEEAPKKRKPVAKPVKAKAKAKPKGKPRSRTPKIIRMKVVWGVFNNSNQRVATYEYPKRKEADAHAATLTANKKNTHFVQPIKEPMEEKKEV